MERGLLWLPLLLIFGWLAWMGWNEYQKVEAYRRWAASFDRTKYDIYAVLGQKGKQIAWGKPTRSGPIDLQSFSLEDVNEIRLLVDDRPVELDALPDRGTPTLEFIWRDAAGTLRDRTASIQIPFTEIALAAQWGNFLQQQLVNS